MHGKDACFRKCTREQACESHTHCVRATNSMDWMFHVKAFILRVQMYVCRTATLYILHVQENCIMHGVNHANHAWTRSGRRKSGILYIRCSKFCRTFPRHLPGREVNARRAFFWIFVRKCESSVLQCVSVCLSICIRMYVCMCVRMHDLYV
jgi:hypothetical protein